MMHCARDIFVHLVEQIERAGDVRLTFRFQLKLGNMML